MTDETSDKAGDVELGESGTLLHGETGDDHASSAKTESKEEEDEYLCWKIPRPNMCCMSQLILGTLIVGTMIIVTTLVVLSSIRK